VTGDLTCVPHARVRVNRAYLECLSVAGADAVVLASVRTSAEAWRVLARVDGLLLTGGDDLSPRAYGRRSPPQGHEPLLPDRERSELALAREALRAGIPTLGVCLGCQVMNVALGGTLLGDLRERIPRIGVHRSRRKGVYVQHAVEVHSGTLLRRILARGRIRAASRHHQAVDRLSRRLLPNANAPDGIVEGVESPSGFYLGVQWHPEKTPWIERSRRLFRALVRAARHHKS